MQKRGQVFLVSAAIIVSLLFGVFSIANSAETKKENLQFYDLGNEINFETKKVIDYGVLNSDEQTTNFLKEYSNYLINEEALFIYGSLSDSNQDIKALHFQRSQGTISIGVGTIPGQVTINQQTQKKVDVELKGEKVSVNINGINYEFELKDGQNFYLVLIKDNNGERFVAQR